MKGQQSLYVYQREWNHLDQPLWFANQHQTNMWISTNITLKPTKAYEIVITGHVKMGVIGVDDIRVFDGLCEETSQLTCDFEKNTCGFISNGTRNSIKWNREQGNNYRDHTTDTVYGYYMHIHNWYIMAWYSVKKGYLLSRRLTSKVSVCVTFWYYIYGDRVASFKFEKISTSPKSDLVRLIDISQHNEWHLHSLYVVGAEMFTLKFEASFIDNGWLSGIIIDDFTVTDGFCPGKQKIIHTCVPINKQFNIQECRGNDLIHKRLELGFQYRPAIANESTCSDIKTNIERRIEKFCQNSQPNRVNYCTFMPFEFLVKWNMCFVVNNTKQLHLYYSCADSLSSPTSTNPIGTVTGITVAVICGIVFTTVLIAALSCLIRRSKRIKRKVPNQGMIVFLNTRSEHQNAVLSLVSDHLSKNDKGIYGKKNCNGEQFDLEESRCNHKPGLDTQIQKEKLISSHVGQEIMRANINVIDKKMKKVDVNMQIKLAATPVDDYAILDPTKTGFNRSECNYEGNRNYQIAMSSITSKEKESDMQDPYVLSETETYDSSANIRHKETDTNIYSHTVDNVYDTTAHERRIEDTESTYDHFFGEQTEDVYDIAKRDQHKLYLTQNKYPSPHQI